MSRSKKITFNMVAAATPKTEKCEMKVDGLDDVVLMVQRTLPLDEAVSFVNEVAASCFDEETGAYMPETFDFVVRVNALVCYAGFDAPKDIKKAYNVVYCTDVYDRLIDTINTTQFAHLVAAAKQKVEHMKAASAAAAGRQIEELIKKIDSFMSDGVEAMNRVQSPEFVKAMERVSELSELNTPQEKPARVINMMSKAPLVQVRDDG